MDGGSLIRQIYNRFIMTLERTVDFTHVNGNEYNVTLPTLESALRFVHTLHCAGVDAIVNLLPEDVAD